MDKKEEFKMFVKDNPRLINVVHKGEMTWQKLYELFDIYGKDNNVWDKYIKNESIKNTNSKLIETIGLADIVNIVKQIDLDSIQNGVSSIQRVLGVLQDFGKSDTKPSESTYTPRPIYKHFED